MVNDQQMRIRAAGRGRTSGAFGRRSRESASKLPLYWLLGVLLLLAPASMAPDLNWDPRTAKLLRIGVLGLVVLGSLSWFRLPKSHAASGRLLLFAGFFTISALWSASPMMGLAYKGLFLASCVVGIALGNAISTRASTLSFLRVMTAMALVLLAIIAGAWYSGSGEMLNGRLVVYGLNPNLLGQSMALTALLALLHATFDKSGLRALGVVAGLAAAVAVGLSGSRGAAIIVLVSVLSLVLFTFIGRYRQLVAAVVWVIVLVVGITVYSVIFGGAEAPGEALGRSVGLYDSVSEIEADDERIRLVAELTKDTRGGIWRAAWRHFEAKPLFGWGWKTTASGGWATYQSAYAQALIEGGIVGGVLMALFLFAAVRLIIEGFSIERQEGRHFHLRIVYAAVVAALLLHGAFESSLVLGTTPNAVILGFALVNLERMTQHRKRSRTPRKRGSRSRWGARRGVGSGGTRVQEE